MPIEKSAGAVVFRRTPEGKTEYLLLKHRDERWSFPKGMIEKGEKPEEAARREVREETGLKDSQFIEGFKETERFFFKVKYEYQLSHGWKMGEGVLKFVTYFLVESKSKDVRLSFEHSDFIWLEFEAAMKKVKYKTEKEVLEKADEFLRENRILSS